jgi:type II secretory pathway predicted ATPase ExeA
VTPRRRSPRMASVQPGTWAPTDPLRAQAVLRDCGISLRDLERATTRAYATWGYMLGGKRPLHLTPADRAAVEELIRAVAPEAVTDDLWLPAPPEAPATPTPERYVMHRHTLLESARLAWQLFVNPFADDAIVDERHGGTHLEHAYLPPSHEVILGQLTTAIVKAGMIAVSGESGSGKTTLRHLAQLRADRMRAGRVRVLQPSNVERRRLTSGHVADEIIRQLGSNEDRTQSNANRRDALAAEILRRTYAQGYRTVLVIDEAHELPTHLMHDLKRWGELEDGFARLLGVLLFGHPELSRRLDPVRAPHLMELSQRMQLIEMPTMRGHVAKYMAARCAWVGADLNALFAEDGLRAMEARLAVHDQAHPLMVNNLATAALNVAHTAGVSRVDADCVTTALQPRGGR